MTGRRSTPVIGLLAPLEKEDEPVNRGEARELLLLERAELLHLDAVDSKRRDQLREDARVALDRAPVRHGAQLSNLGASALSSFRTKETLAASGPPTCPSM